MSYALTGLGVSALPANLDAYPVEVVNGLFWVKEPARSALVQFVGLNTDPYTETEDGDVRWVVAYKSASPRSKNWVLEAVAQGRSVAIKPSAAAMPAVAVSEGLTPYGAWYDTARAGGGNYALIAGPPALIAAAEKSSSQPPGSPADKPAPGPPGAPGAPAELPRWVVPVVIGTAVVAAVALIK